MTLRSPVGGGTGGLAYMLHVNLETVGDIGPVYVQMHLLLFFWYFINPKN